MDGTTIAQRIRDRRGHNSLTPRRVGGRLDRNLPVKRAAARPRGGVESADLGCSSKNSGETPEGRRGRGFRGNCVWPRVSRS